LLLLTPFKPKRQIRLCNKKGKEKTLIVGKTSGICLYSIPLIDMPAAKDQGKWEFFLSKQP